MNAISLNMNSLFATHLPQRNIVSNYVTSHSIVKTAALPISARGVLSRIELRGLIAEMLD